MADETDAGYCGGAMDHARAGLDRSPADALNNSANVSVRKRSKAGFRGVWFRTDRNRWCARIFRAGSKHYLGTFKTKEEAGAAYARAAKQLYGSYCPLYLEALQQ
jgi:hypothetical protein